MSAITLNARCMRPECQWVGRVRTISPTTVGYGQGLFGVLRLYCECGSEPDIQVLSVGEPAISIHRGDE